LQGFHGVFCEWPGPRAPGGDGAHLDPQVKDGKKVLRREYASAQDEWVDFLAPDCTMCGVSVEAGCKCDELAQQADCFMVDECVDSGDTSSSSSKDGLSLSP